MNMKELLEASGVVDAIRFLKRSLGQDEKCPCCGGSSSGKSSGGSGGSSHVIPESSQSSSYKGSSSEPCEAILDITATIVYVNDGGTSSDVNYIVLPGVHLPASMAIDVDFPDFTFGCGDPAGCCVEVYNSENSWQAYKSSTPDPHKHPAESSFDITFESGTTELVHDTPCNFETKGFKMHITPTSIVCDEHISLEIRIKYRCTKCRKLLNFSSATHLLFYNCEWGVDVGYAVKRDEIFDTPPPIEFFCEEYGIDLSSFDEFYVEYIYKDAYMDEPEYHNLNIEMSGIEEGQILTTPEMPRQHIKIFPDDSSKDMCCADIYASTDISISVVYYIFVHITRTIVDCDGNQEIERIERSFDVSSLDIESNSCDYSWRSGYVYLDLDIPSMPWYYNCSDPAEYDADTGKYRITIEDLHNQSHDVYLECRCEEEKCDCYADLEANILFYDDECGIFAEDKVYISVGRDGGWDFMKSFNLGKTCTSAHVIDISIVDSTCPGEIEIEPGSIGLDGDGNLVTSTDWKIKISSYQRRCHDEHISCTADIYVTLKCDNCVDSSEVYT